MTFIYITLTGDQIIRGVLWCVSIANGARTINGPGGLYVGAKSREP